MKLGYNKDFDAQIKKRLEGHEAEVPAHLWTEIEKGLEEIDAENIDNVSIRAIRTFNIKLFLSIAATLLLIGFSIWKFQPAEKIYLKSAGNTVKDEASKPISSVSGNLADQGLAVKSNQFKKNATKIEGQFDLSKSAQDPQSTKANLNKNIKVETISESEEDQLTAAMTEMSSLESKLLTSLGEEQELSLSSPISDYAINTSTANDDSQLISSQEDSLDYNQKERPKVVSTVLNFIAKNVQIGGDRIIEFTETEDGILKADLKGVFNRRNR